MLTLGVHNGHTATACLMQDGVVLACISEERIVRNKEQSGFPGKAIEECFRITNLTPADVDHVGVCSFMPQIGDVKWGDPPFYKHAFAIAAKVTPSALLQRSQNIGLVQSLSKIMFRKRRERLTQQIVDLGIAEDRIEFFEHHACHAATTYYTNWNRDHNEPVLVITLDGSGDAVCATLNIGENGELKRIASTFNYNSICDFYTYVTTFLGMKPMSHEYKVMGMAPYASEHGLQKVVDHFRSYYKISPKDPLQIINTSGVWKWQFYDRLHNDLGMARFDSVAGAVQQVFEEVVIQWVKNAMEATGAKHLALAGGGFMNVKLNDQILNLPGVESLFVFPSCGDESNPVGACVLAALSKGYKAEDIKPLGMIDWGTAYTNDDAQRAIEAKLDPKKFTVGKHDDINSEIAKKIADGKVIGRMEGRMEWGARSLGNRSIIADPRDSAIIAKINRAIKMRDFWMPFAPAILDSYRDRYVDLREDYRSPFMTIAPESREEAHTAIPAGLHPFDRTARCQIVDPHHHPSFHDLISKYEALTGVGGVLNTSFNLHGEAVVMTPEDAIHTFINSDLDVLQIENYMIEKVK